MACENCVLPGDPVEGFPLFGGRVARPATQRFIVGRLWPTKHVRERLFDSSKACEGSGKHWPMFAGNCNVRRWTPGWPICNGRAVAVSGEPRRLSNSRLRPPALASAISSIFLTAVLGAAEQQATRGPRRTLQRKRSGGDSGYGGRGARNGGSRSYSILMRVSCRCRNQSHQRVASRYGGFDWKLR